MGAAKFEVMESTGLQQGHFFLTKTRPFISYWTGLFAFCPFIFKMKITIHVCGRFVHD